jgi:uncharacterized membrane protein
VTGPPVGNARTSVDNVHQVAERALGPQGGPEIEALTEIFGDDETLLNVAWGKGFDLKRGLIVLTDRRLLMVAGRRTAGEWPLCAITTKAWRPWHLWLEGIQFKTSPRYAIFIDEVEPKARAGEIIDQINSITGNRYRCGATWLPLVSHGSVGGSNLGSSQRISATLVAWALGSSVRGGRPRHHLLPLLPLPVPDRPLAGPSPPSGWHEMPNSSLIVSSPDTTPPGPGTVRSRGRRSGMFHPRDFLDWVFEVGIVLKGLNGLLELVGGVLLLIVSPGAIKGIVGTLTAGELSENPHDFIATRLLHTAGGLTGEGLTFGAVYLLIHGVVKVTLVIALLCNKLWAYPWMVAVLLAFIAYQVYLIVLGPSPGLVALTVFDVLIVVLTWREYRQQRRIGTADD